MKEFWSVKDIANLCGCSKPTVRKFASELGIESDNKVSNTVMYSQESTLRIATAISGNEDLYRDKIFQSENIEKEKLEKAEKTENNRANEVKKSEKELNLEENIEKLVEKLEKSEKDSTTVDSMREQIADLRAEVEFLKKQIEIKDSQIATQQKQIEGWNEALTSVRLLATQQPLVIEDKENEEKKVSWWKRIFS